MKRMKVKEERREWMKENEKRFYLQIENCEKEELWEEEWWLSTVYDCWKNELELYRIGWIEWFQYWKLNGYRSMRHVVLSHVSSCYLSAFLIFHELLYDMDDYCIMF